MNIKDFIKQVPQNFTSIEASKVLETSPTQTAKTLYKWVKSRHLQRQSRGIYTATPISRYHNVLDNPWGLLPKILKNYQYYVCGFSALEYYGLTEQIFSDITVATYPPYARKSNTYSGGKFIFFTTNKDGIFGTKNVWIADEKVAVSDLHKTITDIIAYPSWGGGVVHVFDAVKNYLRHEAVDIAKVIEYGKKLSIGSFFKRLGFYLDHIGEYEEEKKLCGQMITEGYSYLDPKARGNKYIAKWRLIVPANLNLGD
jgi:predicted transcriptional regulator of viral defense system